MSERKERINTLTEWFEGELLSLVDQVAPDFWLMHGPIMGRVSWDRYFHDLVITRFVGVIAIEAQKRWAVSRPTALDYARIVYYTHHEQVHTEILKRKSGAWRLSRSV